MITLLDSINTFSSYRLEDGGITLFEPCFCITLFSNEEVTKDHAPESLLTPYRIFMEDFGDQVERILFDGNQSHGVKITGKNQQIPYEWLRSPKQRVKDNTVLDIYAGTNKMERRLPCLDWTYEHAYAEMNQPAKSYFRVSLPLTWLAEKRIEDTLAYITRLTGDFPLSCGYAGFALSFDGRKVIGRTNREFYVKQWIERHPGIMSPDPDIESLWAANIHGIASLGWITLLGAEYCEQMGGITELQQKMATVKDVEVTPFIQNGAMIRIGDTPLLGDTLHGDYLDSYRNVGQILSPLRQIADRLATDYLFVLGIEDEDECKKWFNRFFDSIQVK